MQENGSQLFMWHRLAAMMNLAPAKNRERVSNYARLREVNKNG